MSWQYGYKGKHFSIIGIIWNIYFQRKCDKADIGNPQKVMTFSLILKKRQALPAFHFATIGKSRHCIVSFGKHAPVGPK